MSQELLDLLKVEKINVGGHEYYTLQLNLKIMSSVSTEVLDLDKEKVLQFIKDEMKKIYIRRLLELIFKYLFKKRLKDLSFMGWKIVITPEVEEDCIIIHPRTFSKILEKRKTRNLLKVEENE